MSDMHTKNHDYHVLDPSPWPLISSIGALIMGLGSVSLMRWVSEKSFLIGTVDLANPWLFVIGTLIVLYSMFCWWADTIKESHEGHHTRVVCLHLRYGMILFIASEVMFFVAWFWVFFDASILADDPAQIGRIEATGGQFPPEGLNLIDPMHLPLFNTVILLLSGTTITWAHHALINNQRDMLKFMLILTISLGVLFSCIQFYEYAIAPFAFSGSLYSSVFYMATGFHGFHVILGTIFLIVCLFRVNAGQMTAERHFGFEAAAWYWHFVDIVWLFLFFSVYVWGSWGANISH